MKDPISVYRQTTGLSSDEIGVQNEETGESGELDLNHDQRRAALARAHEIRRFEIELYWKRASYFWVLQAAVFAAVGFMWQSSEAATVPVMSVALAALGLLTALAGWLSAKGSKFWQENWEHHIDMLEDEFEGRLHKTAYVGRDGLAWSVSGVNDRLALCFVAFWVVLFVATVGIANPSWAGGFPNWLTWTTTPSFQTIAILVATMAGGYWLLARRTNFPHASAVPYQQAGIETEVAESEEQPQQFQVSDYASRKKPFLIRREPKI